MPSTKPEPIDGLSPKDIERIRIAIRKVWSWSYPRKLCIKRATNEDGFGVCEVCKKIVPKVYVDHIIPVGQVDAGFIDRLFCPSSGLQSCCAKCHRLKTNHERSVSRKPVIKKKKHRSKMKAPPETSESTL